MDTLALAVMVSATVFSGFVVMFGWRWNFATGLRQPSGRGQD